LICYRCGKETGFKDFVGRGDSCPHCRFDARVCKNCEHYDAKAYNECHEPSADRVVDKEKANFCDFFKMTGRKQGGVAAKLDLKAAAEALFKKK
jgi:hypothetical protein